ESREGVLVRRLHQGVLGAEVVEHSRLGDGGAGSDARQRRATVPLVGDQLDGHRDQLCPPGAPGERATTERRRRAIRCHATRAYRTVNELTDRSGGVMTDEQPEPTGTEARPGTEASAATKSPPATNRRPRRRRRLRI